MDGRLGGATLALAAGSGLVVARTPKELAAFDADDGETSFSLPRI